MRGLLAGVLLCSGPAVFAQQVPDRAYRAPLESPAFASGQGPVVCVDEAHFNFHTLSGRFWPFGQLLRQDGFRTRSNNWKLDARVLSGCSVLVISNAQPSDAEWDEYPYPTPSAFTAAEIAAVRTWVAGGGGLLLIADHMPLAGAAAKLAAAFDVEFVDGFAMREPRTGDPDVFRREDGSLREHPITRGRRPGDQVDAVRTFTGQAFRAPSAQPLLVFPDGYVQLTPRIAWEFEDDTPRAPVSGWLQAAAGEVGQGRAAFFGEAAMFSAQLAGQDRRPMGMNAPRAEANFRLVLNVIHWLAETG